MASKDTREKILAAALALFRERGFVEATMREIANRAGVSTGLAYYYFDSKDAIVLAFYQQAKDDLVGILEAAHQERKLAVRLEKLIEAKFEYFAPNRRFLGALMAHAGDPANPLSPFADESKEARDADIAHFERALAETSTAIPRDLAPHMAKILWFFQLGMLLVWIYDRSVQQQRTRELLHASLKIVVTLIRLSNIPLFKPARRSVLDIIGILEQ